MKTAKDFVAECLRTLVDLHSSAFRCWGCLHKTACILTATIAYDMILTGNF